jgi:hypothetical protein
MIDDPGWITTARGAVIKQQFGFCQKFVQAFKQNIAFSGRFRDFREKSAICIL